MINGIKREDDLNVIFFQTLLNCVKKHCDIYDLISSRKFEFFLYEKIEVNLPI